MATINKANFAELFRADFNVVDVIFLNADPNRADRGQSTTKSYKYKVPKSKHVTLGDRLLVSVARIENGVTTICDLNVVEVVAIDLEPELAGADCIKHKWIVARLDDVIKEYEENLMKDYRLNKAFAMLERELERVDLRTRVQTLLGQIDETKRAELAELFGTDLLGGKAIGNGDKNDTNIGFDPVT